MEQTRGENLKAATATVTSLRPIINPVSATTGRLNDVTRPRFSLMTSSAALGEEGSGVIRRVRGVCHRRGRASYKRSFFSITYSAETNEGNVSLSSEDA